MTDNEALDIIRAQGHAAGTPEARTGFVRVWIRGGDESVDVRLGTELHELASGRLLIDEIRERRQYEEVLER